MKVSQNQNKVLLELTKAEALVLFEWICRFSENEKNSIHIADHAEEKVLWTLEGSLERTLDEPFKKDYDEILAAARQEIRSHDQSK